MVYIETHEENNLFVCMYIAWKVYQVLTHVVHLYYTHPLWWCQQTNTY